MHVRKHVVGMGRAARSVVHNCHCRYLQVHSEVAQRCEGVVRAGRRVHACGQQERPQQLAADSTGGCKGMPDMNVGHA